MRAACSILGDDDAHIADVGVCRTRLDQSANLFEEMVSVVRTEVARQIEPTVHGAGCEFAIDPRPRCIGGAILAVGASGKKGDAVE